ncbi:hypothetical protein A8C56_07675 [Niabella ginsenosidivorans]|uniref:Uncharacterized protein n=1 Tax=Niabella ginsenosidivorans TaxID=1176587 RepID=A0A1A9I035_9BACT|nr:hypothetical protein [Niabella ginsenosidivorans]ANH80873.1 hypothetical protein A8C56_07675 [Niabella ginsenosidivorans]
MQTAIIRQKLHQFIDTIEDKKAEAIYTLLEQEIDTDAQRKALIQAERTKYLQGEGVSFTPEEVKAMALNKSQRHAV